ncbi:Glutaredoxin-3 [Saliniradius amylolyticus]|uniref:Glutaredoxin n=1 Tax=Saliniradius amylolyticus TaxID=2183582 RepID=A0A2S2E6T2_9ALTE|nr:glutaredoxin 3 [Saliniradius amylolyticus]AWL13222.1 Glutaredoxin-3 [Saliniradius amylolyticus]
MAKVEIYTKGYCPFCVRAKQLLDSKSVTYTEYSLETQPKLRSEMIERTGGPSTVPQIFIGDHYVGGCDELMAAESQGQLDQLLAR